ncbi:MAG: Ig-like domain-containing protein, partial [Gemmatimonadales bacterium]|nr:Ig-like domain-containing protein [Gemmatimonadales bacterium]
MRRIAPAIGIAAVVLSAAGAQRTVAQVADLQVFPAAVSLGVGQREEILVSAYSASGDYLSNVRFQWSRVDTAIVRVETDPASPPGVFYLVGAGPGATELQIRAGGQSRTISVSVTGAAVASGVGVATILQVEPTEVRLFPLEQIQLQPKFLKDDGTLAAYSPLSWESVRPEVARVDQNGIVAAIEPGVTVVEARTTAGLSRRVRVEVTRADWTFAQPRYSLAPLESDTLRAVVPSQGNRPLDPRQFSGWRSSNPNVVAVSPVGIVTAMSAGTAEITATAFGQEQRVPVTVHPEVVEIRVNPKRGEVLVPLGGAIQFTATALAADSSPIPEAVLIWDVADTTLATFDGEALKVTGHELGRTRLTMRARGFADATWDLEVVATGLVVDRQRLGMGRADQVTLHAAFADSTGAELSPARQVTWTSSAPGVVAVSADGVLQPAALGRAEVVASTPWGVADTTLVFVQGEILVTSTRDGTADIFAFDRTSPEDLVSVTSGPGDDISSAYSPDGSRIALASNRDGNFEIYVVDADGGNPIRLTNT